MDLSKDKNNASIHSAVIILHDLSADSIVLTKRSEHLRNHPGEISFPGGLREEGDKNLYETGVRELKEELGINRDRLTLVSELKEEVTLFGITIHPWLTQIETIQPYKLNKKEVTSLLLVPISLVVKPENYQEIMIERNGMHHKTCRFIPENGIIWGATARIMMQLKNSIILK